MSKKFTLVVDSSQITTFLTCPQLWYNLNIQRIVPVSLREKDEAMNAGTYGHKLLDIYYRMRFRKFSLNDAVAACFAYNPDNVMCDCGCPADVHKVVLSFNECTRCKKCLKFRPHPFPLSAENRIAVRNRFRDYCFKYNGNDFAPSSENHVEVGFSVPIHEDDENLFVLEGRVDLIGQLQGLNCFVDHKFQMKTHWLYTKSIQFKNYALATRIMTLIINYVRLQKDFKPDSLAREIVSFTPHELYEWKKRLVKILFKMKDIIVNPDHVMDERHWNSCSGYKMTFNKNEPNYCFYNTLCEETDATMLARKQQQLFKIQPVAWRPW